MQAHSPHPHINDMIMALIGLETLAYIRPRTGKDLGSFAVCAADGTELAVFDSAESAYFTARQNNLQPVSIH